MAIVTIEELTSQQAVWLNKIIDRFRNDPEVANEKFKFAEDTIYNYTALIQGGGLMLTADRKADNKQIAGHGFVLMHVRVSDEIRAQITAGVRAHRAARDEALEMELGASLDEALVTKEVK